MLAMLAFLAMLAKKVSVYAPLKLHGCISPTQSTFSLLTCQAASIFVHTLGTHPGTKQLKDVYTAALINISKFLCFGLPHIIASNS